MTHSDQTDDAQHSASGWIISLSFWLCLVTAAGIYALVALAPRYLAYLNLHRQFHENQLQLVALERQTQRLEQITTALKNDPAFARELARMDFRTTRPDEQRIPVDDSLSLSIRPSGPDLDVSAPRLPWFAPLLQFVVKNRKLGDSLLYLSAGLVIFAFTFLQDRAPPRISGGIATDDIAFEKTDLDRHTFSHEPQPSAR
jgi:cell division protein FtsB